MAIFRGDNNKKAYVTQPSELIKKNEKTGEVMFAYDKITVPAGVAVNDVFLMQEIPAYAKVLRVKVLTKGAATGALDVGYSSSADLGDKDNTVVADGDAFIDGGATGAAIFELNMPVNGVTGYLSEREKPVFATITVATLPTGFAGTVLELLIEYVAK